mmetsp:Transcript_24554/g.70041  ORF Transcript_24554/g.70041 Transcript_24554/m.70041 type:complete len:158 (-) Transcript_24554:163-636(-)
MALVFKRGGSSSAGFGGSWLHAICIVMAVWIPQHARGEKFSIGFEDLLYLPAGVTGADLQGDPGFRRAIAERIVGTLVLAEGMSLPNDFAPIIRTSDITVDLATMMEDGNTRRGKRRVQIDSTLIVSDEALVASLRKTPVFPLTGASSVRTMTIVEK